VCFSVRALSRHQRQAPRHGARTREPPSGEYMLPPRRTAPRPPDHDLTAPRMEPSAQFLELCTHVVPSALYPRCSWRLDLCTRTGDAQKARGWWRPTVHDVVKAAPEAGIRELPRMEAEQEDDHTPHPAGFEGRAAGCWCHSARGRRRELETWLFNSGKDLGKKGLTRWAHMS
jgi:hypothetical protein